VTALEIRRVRPGDYLQEILSAAHGGRFVRWGRPRIVLDVVRRWKTHPRGARPGKHCAFVAVEFGHGRIHWTAIEGKPSPRLVAPEPTEAELASWRDKAEHNPQVFDMVDPHPLQGGAAA
jgi:hypothetical protein